MMIRVGTIVTTRRTHNGMVKPTNPCMMTCPAIVPTTELDMPDAMSDSKKTAAAAEPSSGVNVWYADWMLATSTWPPKWKTAADMYIIAMLTIPAMPSAMSTSMFEKCTIAVFGAIARHDAILGEARVQVDRVLHHRGADDADGEQNQG